MVNKRIRDLIKAERIRQNSGLELIASENYPSKAVRSLCGSIFICKYAEGYPNRRYYGGCENVDQLEDYCRTQIKHLFRCQYVNVQPHSGSQANFAAYRALATYKFGRSSKKKLKILSLSLNDGSHLTHGSNVSFSSHFYDFSFFPLGADGHIDFKLVEKAIIQNEPDVLLTGYSAYPYTIDFRKFRELADKYNCLLMADVAHIAGLVAAGEHPSPFPWCDIVTTTTHKTLRGPRGGLIMTNNEALYKEINSAVFPFTQGGPLEDVIAAKAQMAIEAQTAEYREYIKQVIKNTKVFSDVLASLGCTVSKTDNHLLLLNTMASFNKTGKEVQEALGNIGITVNKNMIPGDQLTPAETSGIRIGLAALTTRGLKENGAQEVAMLIADYLKNNIETPEAYKAVLRIIKKNKLKKIS